MATYPLSEAYADGQVFTAANVNSITEGVNDLAFGQFNAQTGTTYTLVLTDVAKVISLTNASAITLTIPTNASVISLTNASAITLTIPTNASVAFPTGTQILLYQGGAGQVTVGGAGVTIRAQGGKTKINAQYAVAALLKVGTDEWVFFGNTAA